MINTYLKKTTSFLHTPNFKSQNVRKPVECVDGFKLSIQASKDHYCSPRMDGNLVEYYTQVEIGFPSEPIPDTVEIDGTILDFAYHRDGGGDIYAYIPVWMVEALILYHGGIKS